jgi:hypothetical protein
MYSLSLYLFGSPTLEVHGRPVATDRRKAGASLLVTDVADHIIGNTTEPQKVRSPR